MATHDDDDDSFPMPMAFVRQMHQQRPTRRPDILAQAMDLEHAYKFRTECRAPFVPGQYVHERKGMGVITDEPEILLIWRVFDRADPFDRSYIIEALRHGFTGDPDCLVAFKTTNGVVCVTPHEMWRLEPSSIDIKGLV